MKLEFEKVKNLINNAQSILLTMHERMDGDDGGSVLALALYLEKEGKNITCAIKQGVPPNLKFLPGSHKIVDDISHENFDLLITFGCSTLRRTGSLKIENLKLKIINIDHHPDNQYFGTINLVDANKSSVAELVYDFFKFANWPISASIATCLLTGIITDTGSFMHSNTQSSTLKAAAELLKKGALTEKIIQETYSSKDTKTLKAWGHALSNLRYDQNRKIIYSIVTEDDQATFGKLPNSAFEGLAEILNSYPEAKFAMFLRQEGNIIKGSLRTDPYKQIDVAEIAKSFGGGGHKMAAGFSVAGRLVKETNGKWRVV